ncbi:MarR family winged helix-turn-helix transcriptional regulator [Sphingobium sp.]|uniref:MarR family winged helix-turn-helix transcriptional regulator n=1 Tax=Sphingobium sp. TaxID=1912891 RepID=UPI0035C7072D
MSTNLLMLDLVKAIYWFDESLQQGLRSRGWNDVTRAQSLVLANLANGESRSARIAENLGVSRQAMSQMLAEMAAKDLVCVADDPSDRRARIVTFSPSSAALREDAGAILHALEERLERHIGKAKMKAVRAAMAIDWRSV